MTIRPPAGAGAKPIKWDARDAAGGLARAAAPPSEAPSEAAAAAAAAGVAVAAVAGGGGRGGVGGAIGSRLARMSGGAPSD